jgi:glutathione-independent formaldehyde dehydrogenase
MRYHRSLMNSILAGRAYIAKAVNAIGIGLKEAPQAYQDFDAGAAKKRVLEPNGLIGKGTG